MKALRESIFDEKEQMKNVKNNALLNIMIYYHKAKANSTTKIQDCKNNPIKKGDILLFSNAGINIMMGLVTDISKKHSQVLVNFSGVPDTGWWIEPWKALKIDKDIAMKIVKQLK